MCMEVMDIILKRLATVAVLVSMFLVGIYGQQPPHSEIVTEENNFIILKCNHNADLSILQIIVWESGSGETIAELRTKGRKLINIPQYLLGRVNITYPDGDLVISNINRKDDGLYKCFTLEGGVRIETDGWQKLRVYVEPEGLQIRCSGTTFGIPNEDCHHIKKDAIKSLKCEVASNPKADLIWSTIPQRCSSLRTDDGTSMMVGNMYSQYFISRDVCHGEYCCIASYSAHASELYKICVTVGNPVINPSSEDTKRPPDNSDTNFKLLLIVILIACAIVLAAIVTLFLVCRYCNCKQLRDDCPTLCGCCPQLKITVVTPDNEKMKEADDDDEDIEADLYSSKSDIDPSRYQNPPPYTPTADEDTVDGPIIHHSASPPAYTVAPVRQLSSEPMGELVMSANSPLLALGISPETKDLDEVDGLQPSSILFSDKQEKTNKDENDGDEMDDVDGLPGPSSLFSEVKDPFLQQDNNNIGKKNNVEQRMSEPLPQSLNNEHPTFRRCVSSVSTSRKPLKISIYKKRRSHIESVVE